MKLGKTVVRAQPILIFARESLSKFLTFVARTNSLDAYRDLVEWCLFGDLDAQLQTLCWWGFSKSGIRRCVSLTFILFRCFRCGPLMTFTLGWVCFVYLLSPINCVGMGMFHCFRCGPPLIVQLLCLCCLYCPSKKFFLFHYGLLLVRLWFPYYYFVCTEYNILVKHKITVILV